MRLQELLEQGTVQLVAAGIDEASLDSRYLLLESFSLSYGSYLAKRDLPLAVVDQDGRKQKRFDDWIKLRVKRIPLQYIIGKQAFMGLEFKVAEGVLIPRQDTETLVEEVLKDYPQQQVSVLDVCTGSGCIAVSLAVLGNYQEVTAVDISDTALEIAKINAQSLCGQLETKINFIKSDLYHGLKPSAGFDIIVSNPPYIPTKVIAELAPEVRDYEPLLALDGKQDGLYFYQKIISQSRCYLKIGGSLYLEVGHDQSEAVSELLQRNGYVQIKKVCDLPGIERVVKCKWYGDE